MSGFDVDPGLLPEVWAGHGRWRPERPALVCGTTRLNWGELMRHVTQVANGLRSLPLSKGDRVAVLGANSAETVEILMGVMSAGLVAVPLSGMLTAEATGAMIADSGARLLFVAEAYLPLVNEEAASLADLGVLLIDAGPERGLSYPHWRAEQSAECPRLDLAPEDDAVIIYSSGTTGTPKGIVHTHRGRHHMAYAMAVELGTSSDSVALATTALYANGTWLIMMPALFAGATLVVMPAFSPASFLETATSEGVTHSFVVPPQVSAVLDAPELNGADLASVRALLSAGAPMSPETKARASEALGPVLYELYGCTEGVATLIKPADLAQRPRSVGLPLIGTDLLILDDKDGEAPRGTPGEIAGRGAALMRGYHGRPDADAEAMWRDPSGRAWFRTGDVGVLDEDGFLAVIDRKKDMIISGGFNIFPGDIERVLLEHPAVAEAAVIGVPHPRWGEAPLALVVTNRQGSVTPEALQQWLNTRVAKHQRVTSVEFREGFPRNALGKVLKRELRQPFWDGQS